jgi:ectoine hydroxylase-related dioxygenase (phytanoyl-CoA dioxygenase family)
MVTMSASQVAVRAFGVKERTQLDSELDRHVEEITLSGYTILPDILTEDELVQARAKIDHIYETQIDEFGGIGNLEAIGDINTAACLLAYDDFFLSLATKPRVLAVVERFLGDYYVLMMQNGIINVPQVGDEQNAGRWHRDLGYQHLTTSRPLGITALYCIDAFKEETGGTKLLPGSHRSEVFPSEEYIRQHSVFAEASAGSVVMLDVMLYHGGGHNRSNHVRRGINNIFTLPFIKQQISLPSSLDGRYKDDPFLGKLLGYESETDPTVLAFRQKRLTRNRKG